MRKIFLAFLVLSFVACQNNNSTSAPKADSTANSSNKIASDTTTWIDAFREFRDALYKHDKEKVKRFIDFPIMNTNNEIWFLAYDANEALLDSLQTDNKPFTELDFDKHFDRIFTKTLITGLLKVKTEELFNKGYYESIPYLVKDLQYTLIADVDRESNTLTINLNSRPVEKNGEILDGEFSVMYVFNIERMKAIKFKEVRIAG